MKALPKVLSFILCAGVVKRENGRLDVLGVFRPTAAVRSFPADIERIVIFAELTNGHGRTPIDVRVCLVDGLDEQEIIGKRVTYTFRDPLAVEPVVIEVRGVQFPRAGQYRFILESDGRIIQERKLQVVARVAEGEAPEA